MISLIRGDITHQHADAIVNAANPTLLGGGGVDGAIHAAGGPSILEECRRVRRAWGGAPLAVGDAVATQAGLLHARWVIHAVGPTYDNPAAPTLLVATYRRVFEVARVVGARTLALPAISTGAYSYPMEEAARLALWAAREHGRGFDVLRWCLWSDADLAVWERAMQK